MAQVAGGGDLPAEIWRQLMLAAHDDLPVRAFPWAPAARPRLRQRGFRPAPGASIRRWRRLRHGAAAPPREPKSPAMSAAADPRPEGRPPAPTGPSMLFDGVDLALEPRVRACLVGRNGAGKSTLLRILAGQIEPDGGERYVTPGDHASPWCRRSRRSPAPPCSTTPPPAARRPHRGRGRRCRPSASIPARAAQGLSGGEIRRAALARAFAEDADVLLLDEPTNHLDILAIETLEARARRSRAPPP